MTKLVSEERLGSLRRMNDARCHRTAWTSRKICLFAARGLSLVAIVSSLVTPAAVTINAQSPVADTIFVGEILTLDPSHPKAEAIAVSAGRIVAIGSRSEVEALATKNTRKIRINGVALPGFADAHIHVAGVGEQLEKLNLRGLILPLYLMNKVVASTEEAVSGIFDGATIMVGGFGLCGISEHLIRALVKKGVKNLTTISNNVGCGWLSMGLLLSVGQIRKHILRAVSDFDTTHQFRTNWVYELPMGPGHRFAGASSRFVNAFSGGWQFAGLARWTSGFPITFETFTSFPTNWELPSATILAGPKPKTGGLL